MSNAVHAPPRTVLIADDNPIDLHTLRSALMKWGYEVAQVTDGQAAWRALQPDNAPRLVILDWIMPGMTGVEICRAVRGRETRPYVYLLMLTGKTEKEEIIQAFDAGVDDCLTKPCLPVELHARLRVGERILELQDQLLATQENLRFEATHDQLTGLRNRAEILRTLDRELSRARREQSPVAVALADIDHFKRVNDTYGHHVGDAVLREVSRRLSASVRLYDSVGRYGGEEFLILLPGCNAADAPKKAQRLREAVGGQPVIISVGSIVVTLSLGVAMTRESQPPEAEALLLAADSALYQAKANGRNRVEVAGLDCSTDSPALSPIPVAEGRD